MKVFQFKFLWAFIAATFFLTSCDDDEDEMDTNPNPPAQMSSIAEIAVNDGNFTILVDALTRTGLDALVSDESQDLTVFAPTDDAFQILLNDLGAQNLDDVESALGLDGLENVLKYHVLGTAVTSDMVPTGYVATSATNSSMDALSIYTSVGSEVMINGTATVDTPDLMASNGVIHVIDRVILPLTIFELMEVNPEYGTLTAALGIADGDLDALLSDPTAGPFTLFAPDEDAFGDLLEELELADVSALVDALGTDGLNGVLTYHVVPGNVNQNEVPSGPVQTVNGENIEIDLSNGVVITDARDRNSTVISFDIQGTNGVVHGINTVKLPSP